jgi:hypothetical protein
MDSIREHVKDEKIQLDLDDVKLKEPAGLHKKESCW